MADVFISYKKEDRELAMRVEAALTGAGLSCWWDNSLHPRESWDAIIEREIEAASAIVVIWTPRSVASEWVKIEANYGKTRGKLVPLMAEACTIPLAFSLTQAAMLTDWNGSGEHEEWNKALGWIEALMGAASQAPDDETRKQWELEAAVAILTGQPIPAERLPHLSCLRLCGDDDNLFEALKQAGVSLQDFYVDPDTGEFERWLKSGGNSALTALFGLEILDLSFTDVSDISELSQLVRLKALLLDNTRVSDVAPLASLEWLQKLFLNGTKVSNIDALSFCRGLQSLSLSRTPMSDISALAALTELQELFLSSTQVSNISALSALTGLQTLHLFHTKVSDITALSALKGLKELGLSGTPVSDISALAALTELQVLFLNSNQVSDISALADLTELQTLYVRGTRVSDWSPVDHVDRVFGRPEDWVRKGRG